MTFIDLKNVKQSTGDITLQYDFRKMSASDVFKAKLANETVHFGYIPRWRMKRFLRFCLQHKFLYHPPTYMEHAYLVNHNFFYRTTMTKLDHMPIGWLFTWVADLLYHSGLSKASDFADINVPVLVEPRGTKKGYNYVTWYNGTIG